MNFSGQAANDSLRKRYELRSESIVAARISNACSRPYVVLGAGVSTGVALGKSGLPVTAGSAILGRYGRR